MLRLSGGAWVWCCCMYCTVCGCDAGVQEIQRARELQAAAAALPPGAPRPVPGFADVAAELAPRRMVARATSAARAAGIPIAEHLASPDWLPASGCSSTETLSATEPRTAAGG